MLQDMDDSPGVAPAPEAVKMSRPLVTTPRAHKGTHELTRISGLAA
jgi:hypothetical protein